MLGCPIGRCIGLNKPCMMLAGLTSNNEPKDLLLPTAKCPTISVRLGEGAGQVDSLVCTHSLHGGQSL